jgi:hypothetical protein
VVANDARQRPERLIDGGGVREDLGHVRLEDHDVTPRHSRGVRVTPPPAEIVLQENVILPKARCAPSASFLHRSYVRDESLSERL